MKLDAVLKSVLVDLGLVNGPILVAFPSDNKLVVRRQMAQGVNQHAQPFVGADESKKEVRHISFRKPQLSARFLGAGACGKMLVQGVKQGRRVP